MLVFDPDRSCDGKVLAHTGELDAFASEIARAKSAVPERINTDPESPDQGLAKLVLTLIDLLRQLMERQALRRIEAGSLTEEEIERIGDTFQKLDARLGEVCAVFGLQREDLRLDLGPLGDLL